MKSTTLCRSVLATFVLAGSIFTSCSTTSASVDSDKKGITDSFASENAKQMAQYTLDNGVTVSIKRSTTNRVLSLQTFFRGGSSLLGPQEAGIESLALSMLRRGSQKYSYEALQDLEYRTQGTLTSSAPSFDYSAFGLVSLKASFDTVFDAYLDALMHPAWKTEEYARLVQDAQLQLQESLSDPYSRASVELNRVKFKGHPYSADFSPTLESLARLKLADVRSWWESHWSAQRMFVVAVGNFDEKDLVQKLNATIGKIPRQKIDFPKLPSWNGSGKAVVQELEDAGDVAYVRGDFAAPNVQDKDFVALTLGLSLLDDVLFDVVRVKYGACYSAWSRTYAFHVPYASIVVFKTPVPEKVGTYVQEAVDKLASGMCLASQASASAAGKSGLGAAEENSATESKYVPIEQALDFYKAKFITQSYEGQQTNSSIAAQMGFSSVYADDVSDYLKWKERVQAVTSADIVRVVQKYVKNAPKSWIVLGSKNLVSKVNVSNYR